MSDIQFTNDSDIVWDVEITDSGDLMVDPLGDLQIIRGKRNKPRQLAQQAYIRMMTEIGDFQIYPELGADLQKLIGMPNTPATAEFGEQLIKQAMEREQVFADVGIDITSIPTSHTSIRFDVHVISGSRSQLILSIEQNLTELQ